MSLYQQLLLPVWPTNGFRTGWSGPHTDPRFPDTSAKRTCHGSPSPRGMGMGGPRKKKNRRQIVRNGGRDQFSRVLPQDAKRKKKLPGCVLETGVGVFLLLILFVVTGRNCNGCMQQCEIRTGGIIRSIMNESCHRRCFAWLASSARLSGDAQWSPALSLLAFQPVVRVCCYSPA